MVLPPGLGYNISEFFAAAAAAKKLWDAYFDDYDNAPNRVKELCNTIQFVKDTLARYGALFQRVGEKEPASALVSVTAKLKECDDFLGKYSGLQSYDESGQRGSKGAWRLRRVWQPGLYAFDSSAKNLSSALGLEMQKLTQVVSITVL